MGAASDMLARFSGGGGKHPVFLPDLSLWYEFHRQRDSLPAAWKGHSVSQVARALGVPVWQTVKPWRVETPEIEISLTEEGGERIIRSMAPSRTLVARWTVGPNREWWQTEYPVKSLEDLEAVLELVSARSYVVDPTPLTAATEAVGKTGVWALEIPRRPYSDLLHEFLGWSEGLLFLTEPIIAEINDVLESKLQRLLEEIAQLPGELVFSPDNLDGQFISPRAFDRYLADSYRITADLLHHCEKRLIVHVGGPIRRLLLGLAQAGVDGFEGICGPPQSDLSLEGARDLIGPDATLWGGIPQDVVLETYSKQDFQEAVERAVGEARGDGRTILGVADRVPVDADPDRVAAIPSLMHELNKQ